MRKVRKDTGGLPATIMFRCPKGMSEPAFKRNVNRSFHDVFDVPIGDRLMSTEYLERSDSILCYFRVEAAPRGHGFMLLPPDHPLYKGGSTQPFIGRCPFFAVGLGNSITHTYLDKKEPLDTLDMDREQFEYAAKVNAQLRGIKTIAWDEFQKVTRAVLTAHLIEGTEKYIAVTLGPQEDCVWTPLLKSVLDLHEVQEN